MKTQKNLLLIPAILGMLYGLGSIFIPRTFAVFFDIPTENITPDFVSWIISAGVAAIGLGMFAIWFRSLTDINVLKGAMTVFSIFFLLFGVESLLVQVIVQGSTFGYTTFIQGIVFVILAIVFFALRKPKEETK
jgi:uncharacterized membrane protein YozB (DUF420 family)